MNKVNNNSTFITMNFILKQINCQGRCLQYGKHSVILEYFYHFIFPSVFFIFVKRTNNGLMVERKYASRHPKTVFKVTGVR